MKRLLLPILFLALALGLAPSAVLTQPAPTPISPLTGSEQFVLQYAPPSGCSVNCFTTSDAIKAFAGGGGGGNTINLTADTNIAAGSSVSVNSSGHAVQTWGPAPSIAGTSTLFEAPTVSAPFLAGGPPQVIGLSASQFVAFQPNYKSQAQLPASALGAVAFSISGETISVGTANTSANLSNAQTVAALDASHFVYVYYDSSEQLWLQAGAVSANAITLGAAVQPDTTDVLTNTYDLSIAVLNSNTFVFVYENSGQSYYVVCTVSGSTITLGTPASTGLPSGGVSLSIAKLSSSSVLLGWLNSSNEITVQVGTVSGTTLTLQGSAAPIAASANPYDGIGAIAVLSPTSFILTYSLNGQGQPLVNQSYAVAGSISSNNVTFGTPKLVLPNWYIGQYISVISPTEVFIYGGGTRPTLVQISGTALTVSIGTPINVPMPSFGQSNGGPVGLGPNVYATTGSLFWSPSVGAGSTLVWSDGYWNIYESDTNGNVSPPVAHPGIMGYAFAPIGSSQVLALLIDGASNILARVISIEPINASPPIGFAQDAISESASGAITVSGIASGLSGLTPGDVYYHNGDGSIVTANTGNKAGVALTSSTLLIQNYLLNRDLDPASNDNSPAFVNEAA